MTFRQALVYFCREAAQSLLRSWKVSLLAVLTITVSLFVSGVLMLASTNLSRLLDRWRAQGRIVVYLEPTTTTDQVADLRRELQALPEVESVHFTDQAAARLRFEESFPSLAGLIEASASDEPLPASLDLTLSPGAPDARLSELALELAGRSGIELVDDDRDWLAQVATAVAFARGLGFALGSVLLGAAVFTIASVIRLTAYLYREEINIMRIVGATEFFIRGPFYLEGFFQGLLGGCLAVLGLGGGYFLLAHRSSSTVWTDLLLDRFLPWHQQALLVLIGALAGLIGAVVSLRREDLGPGPLPTEAEPGA